MSCCRCAQVDVLRAAAAINKTDDEIIKNNTITVKIKPVVAFCSTRHTRMSELDNSSLHYVTFLCLVNKSGSGLGQKMVTLNKDQQKGSWTRPRSSGAVCT